MLSTYSLQNLKGVGPKQLEKLAKLGLHVVQDLLFHLPLRYQDKTRVVALEEAIIGKEQVIDGKIISQNLTQGRKNSLLVRLESEQGSFVTLRFFHFHFRQAQQFTRGKWLRVFGELRSGPSGLEIVHPSYEFFNPESPPALEVSLTPTYPTTEGLGQASLQKLMNQAIALLKQYPLAEVLPKSLLASLPCDSINTGLLTLHRPQPEDDLASIKRFAHPAQQRLIVEELICQQASLQQLRQAEQTYQAPSLPSTHLSNALLASLPFTLTTAQQNVLEAVQNDLKTGYPMQRLIQGDVGSGKTVIAALAALQAADAGFQVAVMAPTEILAEQHLNAFCEWLDPLDVPVAWLNGRMKAAEKRFQKGRIASGEAKVVIGTHALFQDDVCFVQLGLVIIDEQHRFGVHQRLSLQQKGQQGATETVPLHAHQLVMTATPIPRTLAMTAYGDLDISVIDELPPGRKPIKTAVLNNDKRDEVMAHLATQCQQGVQAYWVCPLIEESELLHAQAAEVTANQISERWPDLRLGLVHGRLKGEQKAQIMQAFKDHQLDLLVATTVIEVGVNVPNASLMIIENAERLGLAQLHQLRGRVGRGDKQSHCVLLYQPPLSQTGKARLNIMRESNDGFKIAEEDLKIRGPGEVLGTKQTGGLVFRIADLNRDGQWLPTAQHWAKTLVNEHPESINALQERWLGQKLQYQHA